MNTHDEQVDNESTEIDSSVVKTLRSIPRPKEIATNFIDEWADRLEKMDPSIEFVERKDKIIEELRYFNDVPSHFKAWLQQKDNKHVHPTLVRVCHVINGHTTIRTDAQKKTHQRAITTKNQPPGVDTNGNIETDRFYFGVVDPYPEISDVYTFEDTVRGTLTDIIARKHDSEESIGIQFSSAASETLDGQFNSHKTIDYIIKCIDADIILLHSAIIKGEVGGFYMIEPSVRQELVDLKKGSTEFCPSMFSKRRTSGLNKIMEKYRYILFKFQKNVKGEYKDLKEFPTDFLALSTKYSFLVHTPTYFSSLFNDKAHKTEWAGNEAYKNNVLKLVNIHLTPIHGERGDICMKYDDGTYKFDLKDERRTLGVANDVDSNSWRLYLRNRGHHGMNPSIVDLATAHIRSDRSQPYPDKPEDFIGISIFAVITSGGNLAIRPDNPSSRNLDMNFNAYNGDQYVTIQTKRIGAGMYPDSMQIDDQLSGTTKIKSVFYYKDLANPDGKRLHELLELYTLIAQRRDANFTNAQLSYDTAVNQQLIDKEKAHLKKLKM